MNNYPPGCTQRDIDERLSLPKCADCGKDITEEDTHFDSNDFTYRCDSCKMAFAENYVAHLVAHLDLESQDAVCYALEHDLFTLIFHKEGDAAGIKAGLPAWRREMRQASQDSPRERINETGSDFNGSDGTMDSPNGSDSLECPFCGSRAVPYDQSDLDAFPSGRAVTCGGTCWIAGVGVDYEAWQSRRRNFCNGREQ